MATLAKRLLQKAIPQQVNESRPMLDSLNGGDAAVANFHINVERQSSYQCCLIIEFGVEQKDLRDISLHKERKAEQSMNGGHLKRLEDALTNAIMEGMHNVQHGHLSAADLDPRIACHYGVPSTASILAFDPIQHLLAIGTLLEFALCTIIYELTAGIGTDYNMFDVPASYGFLIKDGRIKVIGGDNIEGLLISPKKLPFKNLEFLQNEGRLLSVSNDNEIQVWDLQQRYIGDEYGLLSVVKYDNEEGKLSRLPYYAPANFVSGILPQPSYENGLIVLWDVSEARVILARGYTALQLKDERNDSPSKAGNELKGHSSDYAEEKIICSLCWASSCGSILVVGYIDGDILLWNISSSGSLKGPQAGVPSNNVVKLQLSSAERRLPVIILHWSAGRTSNNDCGGKLFIYGGDEIGSDEVLTERDNAIKVFMELCSQLSLENSRLQRKILTLEWSSGIETLRCIARVDLTLNGSFADMILTNSGATENSSAAALFVLTNPGQLHLYDGPSLSKVTSEEEKVFPAEQFPLTVPTVDPCMTAAKLILLSSDGKSSKILKEMSSAMKSGAKPSILGMKWPITGGVPSPLSLSDDGGVERLYIAGYQDGSVRIWDATYPILSLVSISEGEVPGIKAAGVSAPVSALDFCSINMTWAAGNECGLVRVYKLFESSTETNFHFVTEAKQEGLINLVQSESGPRLAQIMVNLPDIPGLGLTCSLRPDCLDSYLGRDSIQLIMLRSLCIEILAIFNEDDTDTHISKHGKGFGCVAVVSILNLPIRTLHIVNSGARLAVGFEGGQVAAVFDLVSMSTIVCKVCPSDLTSPILKVLSHNGSSVNSPEHQEPRSARHPNRDVLFIVTKNAHIHAIDSVTGSMISSRSLHPKKESSAISICNYFFVGNLIVDGGLAVSDTGSDKVEQLSQENDVPTGHDQTSAVDRSKPPEVEGEGSAIHKVKLIKPCCWTTTFKRKDERAFGLALLYQTGVLEIRIPDSLPCLHDEVLAAAADAAISVSSYQKKKQGATPGILGGIIKGFKGEKAWNTMVITEAPKSSILDQLESTFSKVPFSVPSTIALDDLEDELDIGTFITLRILNMHADDIEIDEARSMPSTSTFFDTDEETEREKLFHGATSDMKPRLRTAEEIRAQYRKTGDAASAAADAKDKLLQRQEKLERISRRTAELESGAESFASMANELVKVMERRKWWQI
ncbi:hypothetical protein ACLOJK_031699 [Asimina triloba]